MLPFIRAMARAMHEYGRYYIVLTSVFYTLSGMLLYMGFYTGFIDFAPLYNAQFASICWSIIFTLSAYYLKHDECHMHMYMIGSILSIAVSVVLVILDIINHNGANIEQLRVHFIYMPSMYIFAMAKRLIEHRKAFSNDGIRQIIVFLSGTTFGIFILETHSELINFINWKLSESVLGMTLSSYYLALISIVVQFTVCVIITSIFKKIPIVKKIL